MNEIGVIWDIVFEENLHVKCKLLYNEGCFDFGRFRPNLITMEYKLLFWYPEFGFEYLKWGF